MIEPSDEPADEPSDEPSGEPVDERSDERARRNQTMFSLGRIATIAAISVGVGAGGAVWKNMAADSTVDITFSLECAQLESKPFERIHLSWSLDAFRVVEEMQSNAGALTETPAFEKRFGDWWKSTGVNHYDTGVRLAFNHGIPDGNSTAAVDKLRVVEATQERIDMRGYGNGLVVGAERGYIDRRTGYGEIWQFLSGSQARNNPAVPESARQFAGDNMFTSPVWHQYLFRCKPSPRPVF